LKIPALLQNFDFIVIGEVRRVITRTFFRSMTVRT